MTEPQERPRRGLAVGVAAVLLLAGATYGALRPERTRPVAAPSPFPSESRSVAAWPPSPDPTPVNDDAGEWSFPALTGKTGLTIAGAGPRGVRVLDLDSGRTTPVGGPTDPMTDPVAPIDGGWLVARRSQCVDDGPCAPSEVFAVRGGRATRIGLAHTVRPDVDGRTVWLTRYPGTSVDEPRWLERRTFDGVLVGPRTRLRPYEDIGAVGPDGPVVEGEQAVVTMLDADTRRRVSVVEQGRVLGMAGRLVVWAELSCSAGGRTPCAISTTEPGTGVTAEVVQPVGMLALTAVDPSGEHVAVGAYNAAGEIEVVSYYVSTGLAQAVTGTYTPSVDAITWSPDGRWLVLMREVYDFGEFGGQRIAVWAPGGETAYAAGSSPTEGPLVVGLAR